MKEKLIKKLAEKESVRFFVKEFREVAKDNQVFDEILDWLENDYAEDYVGNIEPNHLIELNFTENGIRYYHGKKENFLDVPIGEESWEEPQWTKKELQELLKGLQ